MPERLSDRLLKLATPLTAVVPTVPPRLPPPGLAPSARLIEAPLLVTVLPPASWTVTWIAGLILSAAWVVLGCVVNASLVAGPTLIAKLVLVAPVSVPLEADNV